MENLEKNEKNSRRKIRNNIKIPNEVQILINKIKANRSKPDTI